MTSLIVKSSLVPIRVQNSTQKACAKTVTTNMAVQNWPPIVHTRIDLITQKAYVKNVILEISGKERKISSRDIRITKQTHSNDK